MSQNSKLKNTNTGEPDSGNTEAKVLQDTIIGSVSDLKEIVGTPKDRAIDIAGLFNEKINLNRDMALVPNSGLHILYAKSGIGKSRFMDQIYKGGLFDHLLFMDEPDWRCVGINSKDFVDACLQEECRGLVRKKVLIDSFKDLLYFGQARTTKAVTMDGLQRLARFSSALERVEGCVIASLNPQQDLDERSMLDSIKGNVTSVNVLDLQGDQVVIREVHRRVWNGTFYERTSDPIPLLDDKGGGNDLISTLKHDRRMNQLRETVVRNYPSSSNLLTDIQKVYS